MIYIVEIPHQGRPSCWIALNEADAVRRMFETFVRRGDTPELDASFDDWCEYNRADLSNQYVFMTEDEAVAGLESITGHGSAAAIDALREKLIDYGVIAQ